MSKKPENANAKAAPTYRISARPERGFHRAGRYWPRQGVEVARAEFTDEQWAAIEAEPLLTVSEITADAEKAGE